MPTLFTVEVVHPPGTRVSKWDTKRRLFPTWMFSQVKPSAVLSRKTSNDSVHFSNMCALISSNVCSAISLTSTNAPLLFPFLPLFFFMRIVEENHFQRSLWNDGEIWFQTRLSDWYNVQGESHFTKYIFARVYNNFLID